MSHAHPCNALDLSNARSSWELAERLKAGEAKLASEKELTDEYAKEIAHWVELCRELQAELDGARGGADRDDRLRRDHKRLLAESGLVADELKDARATIAALKEDLARATRAPDAAAPVAPRPRD